MSLGVSNIFLDELQAPRCFAFFFWDPRRQNLSRRSTNEVYTALCRDNLISATVRSIVATMVALESQ